MFLFRSESHLRKNVKNQPKYPPRNLSEFCGYKWISCLSDSSSGSKFCETYFNEGLKFWRKKFLKILNCVWPALRIDILFLDVSVSSRKTFDRICKYDFDWFCVAIVTLVIGFKKLFLNIRVWKIMAIFTRQKDTIFTCFFAFPYHLNFSLCPVDNFVLNRSN